MSRQKLEEESHITVEKGSLCLGREAGRQARKISHVRNNDVRDNDVGGLNPVTQTIWKGSQQASDMIRFAFLKNISHGIY